MVFAPPVTAIEMFAGQESSGAPNVGGGGGDGCAGGFAHPDAPHQPASPRHAHALRNRAVFRVITLVGRGYPGRTEWPTSQFTPDRRLRYFGRCLAACPAAA